jgi:hypothetical protein
MKRNTMDLVSPSVDRDGDGFACRMDLESTNSGRCRLLGFAQGWSSGECWFQWREPSTPRSSLLDPGICATRGGIR